MVRLSSGGQSLKQLKPNQCAVSKHCDSSIIPGSRSRGGAPPPPPPPPPLLPAPLAHTHTLSLTICSGAATHSPTFYQIRKPPPTPPPPTSFLHLLYCLLFHFLPSSFFPSASFFLFSFLPLLCDSLPFPIFFLPAPPPPPPLAVCQHQPRSGETAAHHCHPPISADSLSSNRVALMQLSGSCR